MIVIAALAIWHSVSMHDRLRVVPDDRWAYAITAKMNGPDMQPTFPDTHSPSGATNSQYPLPNLILSALCRPIFARQMWTDDLVTLATRRNMGAAKWRKVMNSLQVSRRVLLVAAQNERELDRLFDLYLDQLKALGVDVPALRLKFHTAIRDAYKLQVPYFGDQ